jgi:hypothetical protein
MFAKKGTHERLVLCHTTLHFMPESVKNDATDERLVRDGGKVGLWTKADSVPYFDGFRVIAR